jgi:two-component system sensor histidine kinase KdpD
VTPDVDASAYLQRVARVADALDLALEVTAIGTVDEAALTSAALAAEAGRIPVPPKLEKGRLDNVMASFVAVPPGELAVRILQEPLDRLVYVADPERPPISRALDGARHPYAHVAGDRMRIGYGKLCVYFGSVAGSGKTYAMLERAHQLKDEGVDVVAALVETHGRAETAARLEGLELLPRTAGNELDLDALLARKPEVALIDELAHTNAPGGVHPKRYDDVIAVLRAGIDVLTTLNVQHLEGVGEAVERLTGTRVRETLPDTILDLSDDIVFIDVTPQMLRERLRAGKIYPQDRVEKALANFFRVENLAALRELAIRELAHTRGRRRGVLPFDRILLGVAPRVRDVDLVDRMGRFASRLDVDLRVVSILAPATPVPEPIVEELVRATQRAAGTFTIERAVDAAVGLAALAQPRDVLVLESPRGPRRIFSRTSFAMRLLKAGAREMIVLRPAGPPAPAPAD